MQIRALRVILEGIAIYRLVIFEAATHAAVGILLVSRLVLVEVVALGVVVVRCYVLVVVIVEVILRAHAPIRLANHDNQVARGDAHEPNRKGPAAKHALVAVIVTPLRLLPLYLSKQLISILIVIIHSLLMIQEYHLLAPYGRCPESDLGHLI